MDVREALVAICSTNEGYCWYCDHKLPAAEEAIGTGVGCSALARRSRGEHHSGLPDVPGTKSRSR